MWTRRVVILFPVFVFMTNVVMSKKFDTRCKLVRELKKVRLAMNLFVGDWVCLVDQVNPNRDTNLVTGSGLKKAYGLYQIPGKWCKEGRNGGECDIKCESLLDDDIKDDTECAQEIFHREGLKSWRLWDIRCNNKSRRDWYIAEVYKCPELSGLSSPFIRTVNRQGSHIHIRGTKRARGTGLA